MRKIFNASISKGNPPKGTIKIVVGVKDNGGSRWEYVGETPLASAISIMNLCASNGKYESSRIGEYIGISKAWGNL